MSISNYSFLHSLSCFFCFFLNNINCRWVVGFRQYLKSDFHVGGSSLGTGSRRRRGRRRGGGGDGRTVLVGCWAVTNSDGPNACLPSVFSLSVASRHDSAAAAALPPAPAFVIVSSRLAQPLLRQANNKVPQMARSFSSYCSSTVCGRRHHHRHWSAGLFLSLSLSLSLCVRLVSLFFCP